MRDPELELYKALIPELRARVGHGRVYTSVPSNVEYPYVSVDDVFVDEDGPKGQFRYNVDVRVQIVYTGEENTGKAPRLTTSNAIMGMIKNTTPFAMGDNFKIEAVTLINKSESEIELNDSQKIQVTILRMMFDIMDKA